MSDNEKTLRYALQSLPSPKLERRAFRVPNTLSPEFQTWIDDFVNVGVDYAMQPDGTAFARYTWEDGKIKCEPISAEEYYKSEGG